MVTQSVAAQLAAASLTKTKISWAQALGGAAAILAFFLVQGRPLAGLTPAGSGMLAIMAAAVILWITQPITIAFTSMLVIIPAWVFGYVKPEVAFSLSAAFLALHSGWSLVFWEWEAASGLLPCPNDSD